MPIGAIGTAALQTGLTFAANAGVNAMNSARNVKQYDAIGRKQLEFNRWQAAENLKNQKDLFEATGYGAQMDQLKRAGLNPGLIYGQGGGGGQTASAQPGNVSVNSNAPQMPNVDPSGAMMMGMQLELLKAQKENIQADTHNKEAEAGYTAGARTSNTEQDTKVKKESESEIELRNRLNSYMVEANENGDFQEGDIKNTVAGKQRIAEMKLAAQEAVNSEVKNRLMEKDIKVDDATIAKMSADIMQRAEEIKQGWKGLNIAEQQQKLNQMIGEFNTNWGNIIGKEALETVSGVLKLLPLKGVLGNQRPPTIQGFGGKRSY